MNKAEKYSQSVRNIVNYMENHPGQTNIMKGMSGLSRSLATNELANESARSWKSIMSSVQVFHELNGISGIQAFKQNALSNIKLAQRSMKVLNDWGGASGVLNAAKMANKNARSWEASMSSAQAFFELNGISGIQAFKQNVLSNIKLAQRSMKVLNDWGGASGVLNAAKMANENARSWEAIMSSAQEFHELNGISGIQAFEQNVLSNIKLAQRSMKVLNDWGSVSRILAAEKKAVENLKYLDMLFKPIKSTYTGAEKFDAVAVVRKKVFKEKTFTPTMDRLYDGRNAVNNSILNEYYGIVLNLQEVYDLPEKDFDSIWKDFEQYIEILERDEIVHSQKHNWHYPKIYEVFFRKNSATINLTIDALYGILDKYGTFNVYSLEMFIFYLLLKFYILILCK